jgi:hypothetical protein
VRPPARIVGWAAVLLFVGVPTVAARPAQEPRKIDVENFVTVGGSFEAAGRVEARFASSAFDLPITGTSFAGAQFWYEFGPTTAYGSRTASRIASTVRELDGALRVTSPPLDYERRYHYRLVIQVPDGLLVGRDGTFMARHTPLRPRTRVRFEWTPAGERRLRVKVTVLDAPGQTAVVERCKRNSHRCTSVATRMELPRSSVVARGVDVPFGDLLHVGTHRPYMISQGRSVIRNGHQAIFRAGEPPVIREKCVGDVLLPEELRDVQNRCLSVRTLARGGRISHASIANAVRGTRADVLCRGPGCTRRREVHVVRGGTFRHPYKSIRLNRLTSLQPGATIKFYLTRPGSLGLYLPMRLTSSGLLRGSYRCIAVGSKRRLTTCR